MSRPVSSTSLREVAQTVVPVRADMSRGWTWTSRPTETREKNPDHTIGYRA